MAVRIFNNIPSLTAQRILGVNNNRLSLSVERISSGIRINRAADDAAGLAISEGLRSDIRALRQAVRNASDGISLMNVTEGALNEQAGILIRLRELASQAATGTVGSTERATIQLEFSALRSELDRISATTEFNGLKLIDGNLASSVATTSSILIQTEVLASPTVTTEFGIVTSSTPAATTTTTATSGAVTYAATTSNILIQIGLDSTANSRIDLNTQLDLTSIDSTQLEIHNLSVTASAEALTSLDKINDAIGSITASRGKVGAVQNRLTRSIANLSVSVENLTAAESSIRDADIAEEVAELTRNQILVQTATAMVGQANLIPQSVLQLLG